MLLSTDASWFPEMAAWSADHDLSWIKDLPIHLQGPARYVAYDVSVLAQSGPVSGLGCRDVPDPEGLIAAALIRAGLITTSVRNGVARWNRATPGY